MKNRSQGGVSLVELLIVVLVMGFVSTAALGMLTVTMSSQIKLENKCDSLESARKAIERIGRVIRMGRSFGPGCDANTLVVIVPKFDDNGFPYGAGFFETHTFDVADTDGDGEFTLTWDKNPGANVPASTDPAKGFINTPLNQIIVTGIVSPANGNAFAYVNRTTPATPTTDMNAAIAAGAASADFTGCTVNFEVIDHKNSANIAGQWKNPVTIAYKTEVFLRNNANLSN